MKLTLQAPREKGDWLQKPLILPLEKGKVTGVVGVPKREQGALLADLLVSLSEEEKAKTAYVLSDCPYVKMLTGWDNADILESTYPDFCKSKFAQWGQRFGLPLDAPLDTYTKGAQALFGLAAALCRTPKLLFLDVEKKQFQDAEYAALKEGLFALWEKNPELAVLLFPLEFAVPLDEIVLLEQGKQIYAGTYKALFDRYRCLTVDEAKFQYLKDQYKDELLLYHAVARNVTMYLTNSERLHTLYGARELTLSELLAFFWAYHKETGHYLFGEEILNEITSKYKKIPDTRWKQEAAATEDKDKKRLPFESPYE